MTNARGLRRARLHSNSFLKDCRCFGCGHKSSGHWIRLRTAKVMQTSAVTAFASIVWIPQALTKIVSPSFWQRGQFGSATQKLLVCSICSVQTDNIRYGDAVLASGEKFYRVTSRDFPFYQNCQVEPRPTALDRKSVV